MGKDARNEHQEAADTSHKTVLRPLETLGYKTNYYNHYVIKPGADKPYSCTNPLRIGLFCR